MNHWLSRSNHLLSEDIPFVIITLIDAKGYAPQDPGARAIVTKKGLHFGTVGGGKVEAKAIQHSLSLLETNEKKSEFLNWNLQRDVGMTCGGEVSFFFEKPTQSSWEVFVFGAGHVSQALTRLLLTLDCRVACIDTRSEWLDRLPQSDRLRKIRLTDMTEAVGEISEASFVLLMTQGHASDLPILKALLTKVQPRYCGVIGSPVKAIKIRNELKEFGVSEDRIERLRCPIGLRIGSNDPAEIAISVAAELLEEKSNPRASQP